MAAPMSPPTYTRADLAHSPMIVFYETTRACDLMCLHCRADAQKLRHPSELSTTDATKLFDQLATFPKPPLLVLTGGDPLKRHDIFTLVNRAVASGLQVAMTPSATPLVTRDAIQRLKDSGLHRLAVSLDGPDAETHDNFRRVRGSFAKTLQIIRDAREIGLPVQINTTMDLGQGGVKTDVTAPDAVYTLDAQVPALPNLKSAEEVALLPAETLSPTEKRGRPRKNPTPKEMAENRKKHAEKK